VKRIFVVCLFFISISQFSFGQDGYLPLDDKKNAVYSDVGAMEQTKDRLFQNSQKWVVKSFGNYENAVDQEDRAGGKLVIKTYAPISSPSFEYLRFTMTITCSDNKYLASISELEGIAKTQSVTRLGQKQNDAILEKSIVVKTETNRKKKTIAENLLNEAKADNDNINQVMFSLLASLKQAMLLKGESE
jgi:hypothetical protein